MAKKGQKLERVVYEEKPMCGRCGAGIVGVIPKKLDGKPLCRECAFELEQMALKSGGKVTSVEIKEPLTPEEKQRRITLGIVLGVLILFMGWRIYALAPMVAPEKVLRHGTLNTDAVTDRCIEQLWALSRLLQEGKLPDTLPSCPLSGRSYLLVTTSGEEDFGDSGDTEIRCPNPEEHRLASLSVSLHQPVPRAVALGER